MGLYSLFPSLLMHYLHIEMPLVSIELVSHHFAPFILLFIASFILVVLLVIVSSFTPFPVNFFHVFPCLIVLAMTSNTMLSNSGDSGHPCLVPDLSGNALNFSPV